ncbi:hypothetical protein LY76DRAFT_643718, partial [Colletotrichum caudatum]
MEQQHHHHHHRPADLSREASSPNIPGRHQQQQASSVNPAPVNPANPVLRSVALSDAVTPGIHQHTYVDTRSSRSQSPSEAAYFPRPAADAQSYFALSDRPRDSPPTSSSNTQSSQQQQQLRQQHPSSIPTTSSQTPQSPAPLSGRDILKRMTLAAMGRRESLSQIRASNPDLQLSGNIISATFNIPHSLRYRKGSDW